MSFKIGLRITIEFVFDILKFFLCTVREYYFWWLDMSRLYCGPQWSYCFNIFEPVYLFSLIHAAVIASDLLTYIHATLFSLFYYYQLSSLLFSCLSSWYNFLLCTTQKHARTTYKSNVYEMLFYCTYFLKR